MENQRLLTLKQEIMEKIQPRFQKIEEISFRNTLKILNAFRRHQLSDFHFRSTSGYAYNDPGREKLEEIWAEVCECEAALVRTQFVSGTHALATVLFGILRPGDHLLSVTGSPYDTMQTVIGHATTEPVPGSLKDFGVSYSQLELCDGGVDYTNLASAIRPETKVALIQRSRGYSMRPTLTIADIERLCGEIKKINPNCFCFVDNCYGEFAEELEPTAVGADIMAGSLIKNPGGGIAPTGGYIAGRKELVELAAYRLTAPGIGSEVGASLGEPRLLFQGLFLAPHVTAQAVKGAIFAAALFEELGYNVYPKWTEERSDIIQAIELGSPEKMIAFCQGLQHYSPVDAHVKPIPSGMPGYQDQVIMAAGTFVQGASIELSADGPLREPYVVYLQGGLTFEHALIGVLGAASKL